MYEVLCDLCVSSTIPTYLSEHSWPNPPLHKPPGQQIVPTAVATHILSVGHIEKCRGGTVLICSSAALLQAQQMVQPFTYLSLSVWQMAWNNDVNKIRDCHIHHDDPKSESLSSMPLLPHCALGPQICLAWCAPFLLSMFWMHLYHT